MTLPVAIVVGLLALLALVASAERAVSLVLALLDRAGLSATFGGLTVLSILTSLPELVAHLVASIGILSGTLDYEIASATGLGANIGSDVVQQTLVLGLVVLLTGGLTFETGFLYRAYLPMIGTTLMTLILSWDRTLSRSDGLLLVGAFIVYNAMLYRTEQARPPEGGPQTREVPPYAGLSVLGWFAIVLLSAHVLLISSEAIVHETGLGGSLIGVVVLGVAAAAPEMVTAISGYRQGKVGLSLGTLIGSNITNPLVAIGGGALLSTYAVPDALVYLDLPAETMSAALLLAYLLLKRERGVLSRWGGIYLIALYFVYLAVRIAFFATD